MASREEYLAGLDLTTVRALEFGPADNPWIPSTTPGVRYIDHLSWDDLKKKMATSDLYKSDKLCEIHFVNDGRPLAQILGDWVDLDVVAASHVVEHVPGLLRWLQDISSVLGPDGHLWLAAPNKRYMFDSLRRVASLEDVLADYLENRIRPSTRVILEHLTFLARNDGAIVWTQEIDPCTLTHAHTIAESYGFASSIIGSEAYTDVHVSVFTPYSFVMLLQGLTSLGLMPFELEAIEPVGFEFFAIMRVCDAKDKIEERLAGLKEKASILPFHADDYYAAEFVWHEPRRVSAEHGAKMEELERLKNSASWRMTKPLRALRRLFR